MRKDSKDLTEIFSVGSNDSNPSIKEIRRKKTILQIIIFLFESTYVKIQKVHMYFFMSIFLDI